MKLSSISVQAVLEMIFHPIVVRATPLKYFFQNSVNLPKGAVDEIKLNVAL